MKHKQVVHNLRHNKREFSPHRFLVFDTETKPVHGVQIQRLWRAIVVARHGRDKKGPGEKTFAGLTTTQLIDIISQEVRTKEALWIFAHNAAFDWAVTRLPVVLVRDGWVMTEQALTSHAPWAFFTRGNYHIRLLDSFSWLPVPVQEIGGMVGLDKPDMPDWDDSDEAWGRRCRMDALIVARALAELMDWWDEHRLGNWSITGPSTGWNSLLHMPRHGHVVIDPDPAARALERRALMGGRREVWRVGKQPPGLYVDLDFHAAHCVVADRFPLPDRRWYKFDSLPVDSYVLQGKSVGVLAEVEIRTNSPRYALDTGKGIFYPIGRFKTTLAGPEILEAKARGELIAIGPGWVYRLSGHMRQWANWVLGILDAPAGEVPETVRCMAKAWSRSVPGRWAGHTGEVYKTRPNPQGGWSVSHGHDCDPACRREYAKVGGCSAATMRACKKRRPKTTLIMGGKEISVFQDVEADHSFPAVLAWIQSWTRVMLGRVVDAFGDAVVVCNTDGALVDVDRLCQLNEWYRPQGIKGDAAGLGLVDLLLERFAGTWAPLQLRIKKRVRNVEILGPQHLILDGERRLAGVPKRATAGAGHVYSFDTWPRLESQITGGDENGYVQGYRTVHLDGIKVAKWVDTADTCWPPACEEGRDGRVHILPPEESLPRGVALSQFREQHAVLAKVMVDRIREGMVT